MMKKRIIMALMLLMAVAGVKAQIPVEVTELLKKTAAKMEHPNGMEIDMNLHMKMFVISTNMRMTVYGKGDKQLMKGKMKILGKEALMEFGFDGQQEWKYRHIDVKNSTKKDTLFIKTTPKKSKQDYDISLGFDTDYRKATMKLKDKYHVITFTNPKDKDDPKKVTVKIDKDNYLLREISTKEGGAKITITINRVKYGVNDNVFVLDTSKYPEAIIVRK